MLGHHTAQLEHHTSLGRAHGCREGDQEREHGHSQEGQVRDEGPDRGQHGLEGDIEPLRRRIGDAGADGPGRALILGGGGTARAAAYAARRLGLGRVYFNRTPSKAAELAEEFGGTVASSLDDDADAEGSLGPYWRGARAA